MKILKYILALMLMLPFLASCDDDEVGNPNVSPQDFVTVSKTMHPACMYWMNM